MSDTDLLQELLAAVKNYLTALDWQQGDEHIELKFRENELRAAAARAERHTKEQQ
jgi:hypothetical protein